MARGQSLTSFCATALKNEATGLRTHSFAKSMSFCAATIVRLKSSLHVYLTFYFTFYFTLFHISLLQVPVAI
jgi:hypothetical protein